MFRPRPKQQEVLQYRQGYLGVAAVPGSGKTATLSYLAAMLLAETDLEEGQEILIVTLVNSAVSNFARQINEYVKSEGLLPGFGYRVRTLHGLANDIVRQKPTLAGLDDAFLIVDERESNEILTSAVESWIGRSPAAPDDWLAPKFVDNSNYRVYRWGRSSRTRRETSSGGQRTIYSRRKICKNACRIKAPDLAWRGSAPKSTTTTNAPCATVARLTFRI